MVTVRSLRRDTRFKQAQKLQSWMVIPTFKTCKVWFFLNPSMRNSGFSRILGSSVTNFPWVFFSLQNFINSSFTSKFSTLLHNLSPFFYSDILESQGNYWFPCFVLWSTRHVLCPSLSRFRFPVFSSSPSFSFDFFESLWLTTYFGTCWGHAFLIPTFGNSSSLSFFSDGQNPVLSVWKSSAAIPFFILLHFGSSRRFPLAPWEVTDSFFFSCRVVWRLWLPLYFLCFFFVLFFQAVLIFCWLCLYA